MSRPVSDSLLRQFGQKSRQRLRRSDSPHQLGSQRDALRLVQRNFLRQQIRTSESHRAGGLRVTEGCQWQHACSKPTSVAGYLWRCSEPARRGAADRIATRRAARPTQVLSCGARLALVAHHRSVDGSRCVYFLQARALYVPVIKSARISLRRRCSSVRSRRCPRDP